MSHNFNIRLIYTILILGFFSLFCWAITSQTQLLKCESKSLQGIRYLFVLKCSSFKRGDIVSIQGFETSYKGRKRLAKRILGLPGDQIIKNRERITIKVVGNKGARSKPVKAKPLKIKALPLLRATKEGNILTPLSAIYIPEGYVFVAGDHPRSFDSRYEEFGLVPIDKIWGRALFSW